MIASTFKRIGIVGTGVIGASWTAYYLARGFDVVATDPAPGAEEQLRARVAACWDALTVMGLEEGASQDRLTFDADLAAALEGAEFVQENGPERVDIKRQLFADITKVVGHNVIVATSSSGILISDVQDAAENPARVVLGHPFNPPHLIPLVEVVGGNATAPDVVEQTIAFYASIGKKPIRLRREITGHIANRLQAALWREAFHLLSTGVATVTDIDAAIAHGPGVRWALLGPFMNLELSGGAGGIGHLIDHLGPPIESWWRELGEVSFTPDVRRAAIEGVAAALAGRDVAEVSAARDKLLVQLLALKAQDERLG